MEGWKDGLEEGLQEGLQKGLQEGRQEGLQEGRLKIAQAMKQAGSDPVFIAQVTGLSMAELETLN